MKNKKYIKSLLVRVLLSIIFILVVSIFVNYSNKNLLLFKNYFYDTAFNFSGVTKVYNKYFGKVFPTTTEPVIPVDKELNYSSVNTYKDGAALSDVTAVYPFKSGIVVFIGQKEEYGDTVIIQGMDGIDYWYSNVENINVKLYDYIEANTIISNAKENTLYVLFMKDEKFLNYEEYLKNP